MIYSSCIGLCLLVAVIVHRTADALPHHQQAGDASLTGAAALASAITSSPSTDARQKRSPAEEALDFEIDDDMIITAATLDDSGCGARMLCELTQKSPEQLNGTLSRKLVQVFDGSKAPTLEELKTEPKAAFQYAAFVGTSAPKDLKVCARVFNTCPFNAEIVLMALREMPLEMFKAPKDGDSQANVE